MTVEADRVSWVAADGTLHEEYRMLFFIGDTCLGETLFDAGHAVSLKWRRSGICYFCHICGQIWGRITLINVRNETSTWDVETVSCPQHPDQWNTPGSFLTDNLPGLIKYMPPDVARRELKLRGQLPEELT